ncbi:large ribosomal subunit protein P1-like [Hylobates moloch]|uniref:large ribosomal subunit protein P1-like n=1 Tax=Hylobates moloch TaxID=81572 RepID=UPI001362F056|nr:large ribosomal subunit protein P1-like [Hylobates moloch]
MASVSKLSCLIYQDLMLHNDDEVTITEHKTKAQANVDIGSLICNAGAGGPALGGGAAPVGGPAPCTTAEKKVEAKKRESEEADEDIDFGLFDEISFVT